MFKLFKTAVPLSVACMRLNIDVQSFLAHFHVQNVFFMAQVSR